MTTAQKLRLLAAAVKRNRRFNVVDPTHCIEAIGMRMNDDGSMTRRRIVVRQEDTPEFAKKFGITDEEAKGLWVGRVGYNIINNTDWRSSKRGAEIVGLLAQRYENNGTSVA